jgi:hypothetical protein
MLVAERGHTSAHSRTVGSRTIHSTNLAVLLRPMVLVWCHATREVAMPGRSFVDWIVGVPMAERPARKAHF